MLTIRPFPWGLAGEPTCKEHDNIKNWLLVQFILISIFKIIIEKVVCFSFVVGHPLNPRLYPIILCPIHASFLLAKVHPPWMTFKTLTHPSRLATFLVHICTTFLFDSTLCPMLLVISPDILVWRWHMFCLPWLPILVPMPCESTQRNTT